MKSIRLEVKRLRCPEDGKYRYRHDNDLASGSSGSCRQSICCAAVCIQYQHMSSDDSMNNLMNMASARGSRHFTGSWIPEQPPAASTIMTNRSAAACAPGALAASDSCCAGTRTGALAESGPLLHPLVWV